jgi:cobalt-zinc-cadmium efflux system outer membrane protein
MQRYTTQKIVVGVALGILLLPSAPALAETANTVPSEGAAILSAPTVTTAAASIPRKVNFREYLQAVEQNSLDLQSQRENVVSAQAGVSIARVRPDPQLTAGIASKELYGPNKPNASTATTAGIAITLETAGKHGKRIRAAESNVKLTEANVGDFLRQLDLDSASAFVEACRTQEALARKQSSLKSFQELVRANETRFKVGDIGMLELRQSRVEADRFATEVTSAGADASAALISLSGLLGKRFDEVFPGGVVDCDLKKESLRFELEDLIRQAPENRNDVQVAKAAVENARANLDLARANRWIDPVVNVGVVNTPRVNPIFDSAGDVINSPAERSLALGLTITIPIPFSRLQHGELIQAGTASKQAQLQLNSILLKAETDVRATYTQYQAAAKNVASYSEHVLTDADSVLDGKRTGYRLGAASILDLLEAQRTADDVYLSYLQTLADLANATVKLQLSAGMRPDL